MRCSRADMGPDPCGVGRALRYGRLQAQWHGAEQPERIGTPVLHLDVGTSAQPLFPLAPNSSKCLFPWIRRVPRMSQSLFVRWANSAALQAVRRLSKANHLTKYLKWGVLLLRMQLYDETQRFVAQPSKPMRGAARASPLRQHRPARAVSFHHPASPEAGAATAAEAGDAAEGGARSLDLPPQIGRARSG